MRANLPSWATFLPKSTPKQSSMTEEEFELRLRAYHRATEILKCSYNASLQKHLSPCLDQIFQFFQRFTPGKKRKRIDLRSMESPEDLCTSLVTLLPLAILRLSISTQDRTQIVSMIRQYFTDTKTRDQELRIPHPYRPVVCILKDTVKQKMKSRINHHFYLRDVLIQCLQQERNSYAWSHLLENSHRASMKQSILEWARSTTTYNAILIVFENPESTPSETLGAFMNSITELRSIEGVPISMIMCSSYQGLVETKLSSLESFTMGGRAGVVIESFDFLQKACIYDEFVSTLYLEPSENRYSILFSGDLLHSVREDYYLHHNSLAEVYLQFKNALAHHFVKRGSFLSMTNDRVFTSLWGENVAWFCTDGLAREFVLGKDYNNKKGHQIISDLISAEQECHMKILLFRMLHFVLSSSDKKDLVLFEGLLRRSFSVQYSDFLEKIYDKIRHIPIESFLSFLSVWLQETKSIISQSQKLHCMSTFVPHINTTLSQHSSLSSFIKFVERSLVLLKSLEEKDSVWDFREEFISELHTYCWKDDNDRTPTLRYLFSVNLKVCDKFGSKPRTEIASAIFDSTGILSDVYAAFYVFDMRVITTDDWFQRFVEEVANGEIIEHLLQRFALAVYQLLFCGYVVRSQRRDDAFEKAAMAWATPLK